MPDRTERAPLTEPRPLFFWVAVAAGACALSIFGVAGTRAVQHSVRAPVAGWTDTRSGPAWVVATVDGHGPAAGALRPGDQIVSVDGDLRAARIGSLWFLEGVEPGRAYTVDVVRDGRPFQTTLTVEEREQSFLPWVLVYLAIAAAFFTVAIVMAVAKPESRTVQYGYVASVLSAGFIIAQASRLVAGVRYDPITGLLGLTFPLLLMFALLFFDRFPEAVVSSRRWRMAIRTVVATGGLTWLGRVWVEGLRLMPAGPGSIALDWSLGFVSVYQAAGLRVETAYSGAVMVFIFAVLLRNYRLAASQTERRRIKLVMWSHALVLVPMALIGIGGAVLLSLGLTTIDSVALRNWTLAANALLIASPLSFGYAIVKHRVLGFRVFVRLAVQYALAQNVLRIAVALPVLLIGYGIVSNPDRTVGEVLYAALSGGQIALMALAAAGLRFRAPLAAAIDRRFFRAAYDQEAILLRLVDSIKQLDSLAEISAMVSREIDAALQVGHISMFHRSAESRNLLLGFSSIGDGHEAALPPDSPLLAALAGSPLARTRDELQRHCPPEELAHLDRLKIELVLPITGIDGDLCGMMLIGEKRSEEPFTAKDRNLLQMVAAQVSAVYEILALREQVGQQHRIQSEVLARLESQQVNVVKECPRCGLCCDSSVEHCPTDGERLVPSLPVDRAVDGKYRLERLIGRGGMGAVYQATDLRLNRLVAVKVMRSSAFGSSAMQRRFAREAQASGRLMHENIVRVYDFGVVGETAYLVMEYLRGVTLRAELDRVGRMATGRAATMLDQVIEGMAAAHQVGVLHRDLKPENLLLCSTPSARSPFPKILDFGLAKVNEASFQDPKSLTVAGVVMGTFGYMSPEQLDGADVDERTDVYSLGVIALETITGRLRTAGRNFHQKIDAELTERLVTPAASAEHLRVAEVLRRALAPNARQRIASMTDLRTALIPALRACPDLGGDEGALEDHAGSDPRAAPSTSSDANATRLPSTEPGRRT